MVTLLFRHIAGKARPVIPEHYSAAAGTRVLCEIASKKQCHAVTGSQTQAGVELGWAPRDPVGRRAHDHAEGPVCAGDLGGEIVPSAVAWCRAAEAAHFLGQCAAGWPGRIVGDPSDHRLSGRGVLALAKLPGQDEGSVRASGIRAAVKGGWSQLPFRVHGAVIALAQVEGTCQSPAGIAVPGQTRSV